MHLRLGAGDFCRLLCAVLGGCTDFATLLGMGRYDLDGFLKRREVWLDCKVEDLRQEVEVGERLWKKRQDEIAVR
jgi:hypothetical protein